MPQTFKPDDRVIRLRDRKPVKPSGRDRKDSSSLPDLTKYQDASQTDDYRHRTLTNVAAAIVILLLVGAGIWLAESMADLRKNQDCVLAGRRNCVPLDVPIQPRW